MWCSNTLESFAMTDLFASPKNMLRWGKKRIADLHTEIEVFAKDKPWSYVVEPDPQSRQYLHKLAFTARITDDLPNILFDAANNLRSALDQTAFTVGVRNTGTPNPKFAKFPFGPTELDVINNAAGGCKDLPTEIRDFFVSFKPHKRGNAPLWALNELANTPKHKTLKPLFVGAWIGGSTLPTVSVLKKWHRERHDIVFANSADPDVRYDANFAFTVAFDDIDETIRGKNPVSVLNAMAGEVERVLVGTEVECRRIGLD
jgi:hypothetical protein